MRVEFRLAQVAWEGQSGVNGVARQVLDVDVEIDAWRMTPRARRVDESMVSECEMKKC